jgi:hypothetical protein
MQFKISRATTARRPGAQAVAARLTMIPGNFTGDFLLHTDENDCTD